MKLKKLFKDTPVQLIKGSKDVEITGISVNSKLVAPGNLFIAKKGHSDDGALYIPEAISAGASAILTDILNPCLKDVVQIIHADIPSIEGKITAEYYQHPSAELFIVGITGTNGKTTTSFMIKHLLDTLDGSCGLIGTIEYIIGNHRYQAVRTTPDVTNNHKMLREMVLQGCKSAVMEVTSHALDQNRVAHIDFDVAVFTNLTQDHLDYHETMDQYSTAKQKLFRNLKKEKKKKSPIAKTAVINADSPWASTMTDGCVGEILTYGIDTEAVLRASDIVLTAAGTRFNIHYKNNTYPCSSPLIGRHNVYNYLAAAGVGLARNMPIEEIIDRMKTSPPIPGRLEPVPNKLGLNIYVDYAHTDDALINVLKSLRELAPRRLITIFGCAGDRDRTKRPKMARAAEEFSDISIVTSDNPRSEDAASICLEVASGFKDPKNCMVEIDRQMAIEKAIHLAGSEDIVLIAGKGHESYQIFAHKTIEFNDRKVAVQACEKRENGCCV